MLAAPEPRGQLTTVAPLDGDSAARLDRDGYLVIHGALSADTLASVRAAFDAGVQPSEAWPVPRGRDWRHALVDLDPVVQALGRLPALLAAAAQLIGGRFLFAQVEGREPLAGGGYQMLHRDDPEGLAEGPARIVSALAFLDSFGTQNGATRVMAATHRGEGFAAPPGVEHPAVVGLAGEAGDILVFDGRLLHAASRNENGERRRSLLFTYIAEAIGPDYDATRALRSVRMDTSEVFGAST